MADPGSKDAEVPPAAGPDAPAEPASDVSSRAGRPSSGRPLAARARPPRKPRGTGLERGDKNRKRQADIRDFSRHVAQGSCGVCLHPEKDEIEEAYAGWHSNLSIAREFEVSEPYLKSHARVFEWDRRRAANMDRLYEVLINELGAHFDPSQLAQKDIIGALGRLSRHVDRLQGRIIDRHQVDQRKTVTFVAIPLAGGSAPIIPEGKQKLLASGPTLDAQFEPDTPHGQEESFADPTVGLSVEDVAARRGKSLADAASKDRRSAPAEEKEQE